jgi:hypothetical protein
VSRVVTVDVEFDMPTSGTIAEYREALDELERLVPPEYRDGVCISWGGETAWDVAYATCSIYYEKDETPEERDARLAEEAASYEACRQSRIEYLKSELARLEP